MRVVVRLVYMGDRFDTPRFNGRAGASEADASVSESEVVGACVAEVVWASSSDDRSYVAGVVLRGWGALAGVEPRRAGVAVKRVPSREGAVLVRLIDFCLRDSSPSELSLELLICTTLAGRRDDCLL